MNESRLRCIRVSPCDYRLTRRLSHWNYSILKFHEHSDASCQPIASRRPIEDPMYSVHNTRFDYMSIMLFSYGSWNIVSQSVCMSVFRLTSSHNIRVIIFWHNYTQFCSKQYYGWHFHGNGTIEGNWRQLTVWAYLWSCLLWNGTLVSCHCCSARL